MNNSKSPLSKFQIVNNTIETMFISVTNRCNLHCSYCSANAGPHGKLHLPISLALEKIKEWVKYTTKRHLTLIITGGEPTLWGYSALNNLCSETKQLADRHDKTLKIGLQSNGTTINKKFIDFCHNWDIKPCFSYDGLPTINDSHRGGSDKIEKSLKILQAENIDFGIIACLTNGLALEIDNALDWYAERGFKKLRINSLGIVEQATPSSYPSADQMFSAWQKILQHMENFPEDGIKELNSIERLKHFDQAQKGEIKKFGCHKSECGCGNNLAVINPDGNFCMCVERSMSHPLPKANTLLELKIITQEFWRKSNTWEICKTCNAFSICDHGCVAYHRMDFQHFKQECRANKMLWTFLENKMANTTQLIKCAIKD